ncbi:unnamed protein product [Prunus brigantina]
MPSNKVVAYIEDPPGSAFPIITTTCPIGITIPNKIDTSVIGIPQPKLNSPTHIFYDSLNSKQVRLFGVTLKPSTHTNTKRNVRSTSSQVEKTSYHASIESLIHTLAMQVSMNLSTSAHWSSCRFCSLQTKF